MIEGEPSTLAPHGLRRQLALRDLVLAQILCVVGSSWVGVAAGLGKAQTLTWVAAMLLFYVPMGASVIALNRLMPLEGGLYAWAHQAFGDLFGFLTAWNLWVYGVAVTATILDAIPTEISYLVGRSAAWVPEDHIVSLVIVTLTIVGITAAALRGLEVGKWIHNAGGIAMLLVFGALVLLPVWRLIQHAPIHWSPFAVALPPRNLRSMALFGQMLVGALSGLEYIAILAGESYNAERSIGQSVWLSSPLICAMFILGTSSVVAFVPQSSIDFIAPIPQTLRFALGNSGWGYLLATGAILLLQVRLLSAASYIFTGTTRLPMTAGWDHLVPSWFTRLHPQRRTPVNAILCTAGLIFLLIVLANVDVHAQEAYQVLTNASLTHYELAYVAMFAIPLAGSMPLRRSLPPALKWTSAVGLLASVFSLLISAYPFVNVVDAGGYAAKIIGPVVGSNAIALLFYATRRKTLARKSNLVEFMGGD